MSVVWVSLGPVALATEPLIQAESICTGDIYVTYRKERPIGAIGACVGTRKVPGPCPIHGNAPRRHSAHETECRMRSNPLQRLNAGIPYSIVLLMECAPIHRRRTVEVD